MNYVGRHVKPSGSIPQYLTLLWFPLTLLFQELVVKVWCFGKLLDRGTLYTLLFTLALGALFSFLCALLPRKGCRILSLVLEWAATVWFAVQTVYFTIFKTFLALYSLGGAGQVMQFWRDILSGIAQAALPLILLLLPALLLSIFGSRAAPDFHLLRRAPVLAGAGAVALYLAALVVVSQSTSGVITPKYLYFDAFVPNLSISNFGVMTTLRLDAKQLIFPQAPEAAEPQPEDTGTVPPEDSASPEPSVPIAYEDNVMDIDFDGLLAQAGDKTLSSMHQYFSSRTPTSQNEYTGMFQGKNLILITAEGFSRWAVDEDLTPTLYKLSHSGFVFENFYNPLWWVSTLDGEYVACTSLIPKPGVWSMYKSGANDMYFCLGNQFSRLGYATQAYHDHTWDYYSRDVSHPNMGYDYKGLGHGLEVKPTWPESDLEMMEVTVPEYIGSAPFHTYYMTVSGHMNYTFMGNSMASKHRDEVSHLDLGENAQAYLACQMELDLALENLVTQLEEAGELDNTVIALSADHYPYGLESDVLAELNGGEAVDMRFDVYHSTLILWCAEMEEPVVVDKPCSSLDILPTLSNLFGLEYDSRLLMGRDALSDAPALVVLSDRSFITDLGRYDSETDTFTPNEGAAIPENYAVDMIGQVNDMFTYSKLVLEQDYYGVLFGDR